MENTDEITGTMQYREEIARWQGEYTYPDGGLLLIWVSMATFVRYRDALMAKTFGEREPDPAERAAVVARCCELAYWRNLAIEAPDPEIHLRVRGRQRALETHDDRTE